MIQISEAESSPSTNLLVADDTPVGLDIGEVFAAPSFVEASDLGAMLPLMRFWSASTIVGRFLFEPWEVETLAEWGGAPGAFVSLLRRLGYLVPHAGRLRIAGPITEDTRVGCGLASVMDLDIASLPDHAVVVRSNAPRSSTTMSGGA
jgi:hypothetical protein